MKPYKSKYREASQYPNLRKNPITVEDLLDFRIPPKHLSNERDKEALKIFDSLGRIENKTSGTIPSGYKYFFKSPLPKEKFVYYFHNIKNIFDYVLFY